MEWEAPFKRKANHSIISKLYALVPEAAKKFNLQVVDDPVFSLCSTCILPMEADGFPRDPCDKSIEQALWKDSEAPAAILRTSTTGSHFSRAAYSWASDLTAADTDVPKPCKNEIKQIALASAFAADAVLDAVQLLAQTMASSVITRCNTWLRSWEADPLAQARVTVVPFKGRNPFSEGSDKYLFEDKDKKKVLPSKKMMQSLRAISLPFRGQSIPHHLQVSQDPTPQALSNPAGNQINSQPTGHPLLTSQDRVTKNQKKSPSS